MEIILLYTNLKLSDKIKANTKEEYNLYKGVLFFDYDGTLVDKNEKIFFPTEKTISSLKNLQNNGYALCLATGRSLSYVPECGIDFDCMITNNGGYTFYKNEVLCKKPFDKSIVNEMFDYCSHNDIIAVGENENSCYCNNIKSPMFLEKIHMFNLTEDLFKQYNGEDEDIYKFFIIYPDHSYFKKFEEKFSSRTKITLPHLGLTSCEINPMGVSKQYGVDAILKRFSLTKENAYAFGDGGNDIDMLLAVKNSVVMGHHSPLLDGKGDFVTDTVKNEGIYKALLHYGLLEE